MRRFAAVAAAVMLLGFWASPAGAIETESFGLAPAGSSGRTALHEEVRPGRSTDDAVRVWNKTDRPITIRLSVQGASIDDSGQVSLGGTEGAFGWTRLSTDRVALAPRASAEVKVTVKAPRDMPKGTSTAAIVAELEPGGATGTVSVVQRVALMVYAKVPAGASSSAPLGWPAWLAVGLLGFLAGYAMRLRRRKRAVDTTPSFRHVGTVARVLKTS